MPERLQVAPVEGATILLNEIFHRSQPDPRISKILHGTQWVPVNPEVQTYELLAPQTFAVDPQRSQLLLDAVNQALATLVWDKERQERMIRMRFGLEDGMVHTYAEIGFVLGISRSRVGRLMDRALRILRHPSRSKIFKNFMP